jgi:uncharacterized membrane protein
MPRVCSQCGAQMPDISSFCAACGNPIGETKLPQGATLPGTTLKDNLIGAAAYITFIPAVILLLVEPYNKNRFIRFHSFQSVFLTVAAVAAGILLRLVFAVLSFIPVLGHFVVLLTVMVAVLGWAILWMVLLVKAVQGEIFILPFIGDWAQKQSNLP